MTHETIQTLFRCSLFIGCPAGLVLLVLWQRKVYRRITRTRHGQRRADLGDISAKVFFFSLPGILVMILCAVPAFYFSHLLKQEDHCIQMIRVNKGIRPDNPDIREDCGNLDIPQLFSRAQQEP